MRAQAALKARDEPSCAIVPFTVRAASHAAARAAASHVAARAAALTSRLL